MKLEQQVTSLDLSKRLKGLGVKQESLFYWVKQYAVVGSQASYRKGVQQDLPSGTGAIERSCNLMPADEVVKYQIKNAVSAFTVAELFELMPEYTSLEVYPKNTTEKYRADKFEDLQSRHWDNSSANALAKMLIYLVENQQIIL